LWDILFCSVGSYEVQVLAEIADDDEPYVSSRPAAIALDWSDEALAKMNMAVFTVCIQVFIYIWINR